MRGPSSIQDSLDVCLGKVTKIAGKGRKQSQHMEGFPVYLLRLLVKAPLLSNKFEKSNDKFYYKKGL